MIISQEHCPTTQADREDRTNSTNVQYGQRTDIITDTTNRYKSGHT